jgi:hypothetical protein
MMRLRILAIALLLAASCTTEGGDDSGSTFSSLSPSPSTSPASTTGSLLIEARLECCFIEGGYFFIRVLDAEGKIVLRRSFPVNDTTVTVRRTLPGGRYDLVAFSAPCSPNGCSSPREALEVVDNAPDKDCGRERVAITPDGLVKVFVEDPIGSGCAVTID